ncbi:MAG: sugar phosphate isomerase/epimerase family protein [bacterium]
MTIRGVGINAHSYRIKGDLEVLEVDLACFEQVGFDYVEIPIHGVDGVVGGELNLKSVEKVKEALRKHHLKATVHSPDTLNLREGDFELSQRVFKSSIKFTSELEAEILVSHGGNYKTSSQSSQHQDLARLKEIKALGSLSDYAAERGVQICIENVGSSLEELVRMVEEVDRENVGITYDFGHAFLFYSGCGKEGGFLKSIEKAAPYLKHVHIHDNFGRLTSGFVLDSLRSPYIDRLPFGEGDLHMPPGMGKIPYKKIIPLIKDYRGVAMIEIDPRYKDFYEEALTSVKKIFEEKSE